MIRVLRLLLAASVVLAAEIGEIEEESISVGRTPQSKTWNQFLGTENVIPECVDYDFCRYKDVVGQLKELLADEKIRSEIWRNFKVQHKKKSGNEELFFDNLCKVAEHNVQYEDGSKTWQKGVNEFTDWTEKEFMSMAAGAFVPYGECLSETYQSEAIAAAPTTLDLRTQNIITPVKNQENCGSCTLFSVTGITEAAIAKKTGAFLDLAEQELVDCITGTATTKGTGCNGNWYEPPFDYVIKNGLVAEKDYPYEAQNNFCRRGNKVAAGKIIQYTRISPSGNEVTQQNAMHSGNQPVAVVVDVSSEWSSYKSGVYIGTCGNNDGLHAVHMIGYGTQNGEDYWLIKNSWGQSWGDRGYIKLRRGVNKCGVAEYGYTATL